MCCTLGYAQISDGGCVVTDPTKRGEGVETTTKGAQNNYENLPIPFGRHSPRSTNSLPSKISMELRQERDRHFGHTTYSGQVTRGVITGCSLSGLRARKLLGKKFFLANAFFRDYRIFRAGELARQVARKKMSTLSYRATISYTTSHGRAHFFRS